MRLRMTTRQDDLDEIEQIINQAYPCLDTGNFYPNHAVVVTFLCMLHNNANKEVSNITLALDITWCINIWNSFIHSFLSVTHSKS